jgi:hypothetical protein
VGRACLDRGGQECRLARKWKEQGLLQLQRLELSQRDGG